MKKKFHLSWVALMLIMLMLIGGCSSGNGSKGTIKVGLSNWAEDIAISNMWKQILEDKGYKVELTSVAKSPLFSGIANKDLDLSPEVWMPTTDKPYYDKYKKNIDLNKSWYEGTDMGLVVPKYMKIDSITQLNDNKEKFDGKIIGIEPGASEMEITRNVVKEYNLDYDLIESSSTAMMASLKKAYDAKEPVLVPLWNPHWAFAQYDLKYLKDPKNLYGDPEKIYWMSRKGFKDDYPDVTKWFNQWHMTHEQLGSLMASIEKAGDPEKGTKAWLDKNQDAVKKWTK